MLKSGVAFLNHGSFGATPRRVLAEQGEWRRRIEAEPIELLGRRCEALIDEAKAPIGRFLGMNSNDFGFVTNATEGINAVLRSLTFKPGDELTTTTHVYNAVRQAMKHVASRAGGIGGAGYREIEIPLPVESPQQLADAVLNGLSERTRLLVIDHVTSPTALVFPVEQITAECAARGIDVIVDGAHVPGMLALDVPKIGAAYYAGNLHKWVCAPKGSAFLWVRPDKQSAVHPCIISHLLGEGFAREFSWQGTRDISNWLSVPKAIEFMGELGWERVRAHNHAMAVWAQRMLCERFGVEPISPLDGNMIGSMATVRLPGRLATMSEEVGKATQQRLYSEFQVEAPLVYWGGRWHVRVCCQVYNRPEEIDRLAEAIVALGATA
jgi:isopenicillin-N epimerase